MSNRLLMCRPSAYDLRYEINDWMDVDNRPNREIASRQWEELYAVLVGKLSAEVLLLEQASDCPDMVFTANAGLVLSSDKVILSRFKHPERQLEEPHFRKAFQDLGFQVEVLKLEGQEELPAFEGEGDALWVGKTLVLGYGQRTDLHSHQALAPFIEGELLSLELVDGRWYHLDTCFLPLGSNRVAFYPGAFSEESAKVIRSRFKTVEVEEEEALKFACNAVVLESSVVLPADCPKLVSDLRRHGFDAHAVPMTEFIKAGGACKCLTLYL